MKIEVIYKTPDFLIINKPAGVLVHKTFCEIIFQGENRKFGARRSLKKFDSIQRIQQISKTSHSPNLRFAAEKVISQKVYKVESLKSETSEETLADWLLKNYPETKNVGDAPEIRPGIVHRLDKDTSGVILVCRNQIFFEYVKKLFQEHRIKKTYLALVFGEVKQKKGVIEKPISIKSGTVKRTIYKGKDKKTAITEYEILRIFKHDGEFFSLLKAMPKTGRTHQIRIHLASIGHPIVGDLLYGKKENPFGLKRQFLHAQSLEFNLQNGSRLKIEADLPDDLQKIIDTLKR